MSLLNKGGVLPPLKTRWCISELAPADSPIAVTLSGSPPRRAILSCVH